MLAGGEDTVPEFPTAALADLAVTAPAWRDLDAEHVHLSAFLRPRELA
jgi:hypothetical protein